MPSKLTDPLRVTCFASSFVFLSKCFLLTVALINTGSKTLSSETFLEISFLAFPSKFLGRSSRSFAISSFDTTVTSFLVPPEKALSFFAAVEEFAPPIVNFVFDGKLYSCPILLEVTFTFAFPGVVPEKISPDAEETVTLLSSVKSRQFEDVMVVPEDSVLGEESLLNIVTVPLALSPTSFLPVDWVETLPSSDTEINSA